MVQWYNSRFPRVRHRVQVPAAVMHILDYIGIRFISRLAYSFKFHSYSYAFSFSKLLKLTLDPILCLFYFNINLIKS